MRRIFILITAMQCVIFGLSVQAQIGTRFSSERRVVKDPVTGIELVFLTSGPEAEKKIYPTHNQRTTEGNLPRHHRYDRSRPDDPRRKLRDQDR
jgi:oligogalacturonide lyase